MARYARSKPISLLVLLLGLEAARHSDAFTTPVNQQQSMRLDTFGVDTSRVSSAYFTQQSAQRGRRPFPKSRLWSTKEEKEQETTERDLPESVNRHQQQKQDLFFTAPTEIEAYEVVDSDEKYDVKLTKEDFVITNDKDFKNDKIMKLMRSEVGVKEILQKSDLKTLQDGSFIPDSSSLPLDVLMQRTLDTFEDVAVHLRRIPYERGGQLLTEEEDGTRKTVIVLGSGWAGTSNRLVLRLDVKRNNSSLILSKTLFSSCTDEGSGLPQGSSHYRFPGESLCVHADAGVGFGGNC